MLKSAREFKPEEIIEILMRRRWFIIIPFFLSMLIGIYLSFALPNIYKAETLILVEPQRVPASYVQPIVSSEVDERVSTISQQIMSRSNLEKIINEFKLYTDPKEANMFMEDKLEDMRKRIYVNLTRNRRRGSDADAFSISFEGKYPEKVMKVANALATYFIDQNLKVRESQAVGTSSFLEDELNSKRKNLERIEEALKQYRQKHLGELPEQLETNLRILERLQDLVSKKQEAIADIRNNLVMLNNRKEMTQNIATENLFTDDAIGITDFAGGDSANVSELKDQLDQLKLRYTDRHPDVVRLKRQIAKIEKNEETEAQEINQELTSEPTLNEIIPEMAPLDLQNIQKKELNRDIVKLRSEINELNKEIQTYNKRVENTPKREQELLSLNRDYDNMNGSYNSLLQRKLEAEIAVNMEKQQKGERFRIIDHARIPQKAISPNMKLLFLLSLMGGLGTGAGLIFLIEYFDKSFRSPEHIESLLGIPVLATLPIIFHPEDEKKQRINQILSAVFIAMSIFLLSGFSIITIKGVDRTKDFIIRFITM